MSCCGKKIPVSSSLAIQNAKRNQKAREARTNICLQLEKTGRNLTVVVKGGSLYLTNPFPSDMPVESSLVSLGCAGSTARLLRSLAIELSMIYKNEMRKEKFEKNLQHTTLVLVDLERLITFCKN